MKMLLVAMLVNALHSAFEDAEKPLNRIGVDRPVFGVYILIAAVMHNAMLHKVPANMNVLPGLIGHNARFAVDIRLDNRDNRRGLQVVNYHAAGASGIAVDQAQHLVLMRVPAPFLLAARFDGLIVADEGFIHFYRAASAAERGKATVAHRLAEPVRHEPCGIVLDA